MKKLDARQLQILAWGFSGFATLAAVVAWGQGNLWHLTGLSIYQIFPLFGLLAFSLMWSHYLAAALRVYSKQAKSVLGTYFEVTSFAVLAAILLHPGLLALQLWRDGAGLPPGSELNYVPPSQRIYIVFALVAFVVFLAYEFRRKFADRSWWKFVQLASDGAMFLIFIHALNLGSNLQEGWFRTLWYFYGLTLAVSVIYLYSQKLKARQP